jgi:hypothetical protein
LLLFDLCGPVLAPLDKDAFEASEHDDGKDDVLVFICLELAAQSLGGFPNLVGKIIELRFVD